MTGQILEEWSSGVAWLRIDNPIKRNAMSLTMWETLLAAVQRAGANQDVRLLALTGTGEQAFVSGSDISGFEADRATGVTASAYGAAVEGALSSLAACPKPTVAVLRGYCVGGGVSIAAACDLRLAEADATLAVPAGRLGVGYSVGQIRRLQDLVGPSLLRELIFTGRRINAAEAAIRGLVNEVAAGAEFGALVDERLKAITASAPLTLKAAKLASRAFLPGADSALLEQAMQATTTCFESDDYREGRAAFVDRREPVFRGQ